MPARTVGRITTRSAFAELGRSRCRGASGPVRATFVPADPAAVGVFPQVGYAIGRSCGGAVVRNTLRRRARAVVRAEAPALPRGAYLLRFAPDAATLAPEALRSAVSTALYSSRPGTGGERVSAPDRLRPAPANRAALFLLRGYQGATSGRVSPCRFYPSCSNYAVEAFAELGFWRAFGLTARRLLRCRPFGPHGVDLVPLPVRATHTHERGRPC